MSQLTRRELIAGAGAAAIAGGAPRRRPNILFVMVDEMRFDAMSCAGHKIVETPNLDRLAKQGTRFTSAYTVSPVCSPARASVFTGRYAHVHGVVSNQLPANEGEIFLPSVLKHYGYRTAISGKLHYRPVRFDYGFDQFWSFSSEGPTPEIGFNAHLKKKFGSPAKWPRVAGTCPWPDDPLGGDVGVYKHPIEDFETEWITDRSLEYLRSRKGRTEPWFLFTSYLKPHSPSVEPQPWFSKYSPDRVPAPKLPPDAHAIRMAQRERQRRHFVDDPRMCQVMAAIYYGSIAHVDNQIGRLFTELDRLGMADNTLVLFTADHGNMLGDHGRWFKGVQYEGSAHVPLIWRGLQGADENRGGTVSQVIENTDLMPTILETAGIPVPDGVQGRSFLNLARGRDTKWKNRCFSQLRSGMLLEDGWKLIDNSLNCSGNYELYNLRDDPREDRNLAADAKQKDRITQYCRQLTDWRGQSPAPIRVPGMSMPAYAHIDKKEREEVRRAAPIED